MTQQESQDFPRDVLHTNATIDFDGVTPLVFWHLNGKEGTLTLTAARARAEVMISVAALAEAEGRIGARLSGLDDWPKPKGFGGTLSAKQEKQKEQIRDVFSKMVRCMADVQPDLPEGIAPGYEFNSRQPMVKFDWYGEEMVWEPSQVRDHALLLVATAEAAESDRFFYEFLNDIADLGPGEVAGLMQEFSVFRQRRQLADTMRL